MGKINRNNISFMNWMYTEDGTELIRTLRATRSSMDDPIQLPVTVQACGAAPEEREEIERLDELLIDWLETRVNREGLLFDLEGLNWWLFSQSAIENITDNLPEEFTPEECIQAFENLISQFDDPANLADPDDDYYWKQHHDMLYGLDESRQDSDYADLYPRTAC